MRAIYLSARARLGFALVGSSFISVMLYLAGVWGVHENDFAYMIWNLMLAWLALATTLLLERTVRRTSWSSWYALLITLAWVLFLPNTFYMITDFIHVQELAKTELLGGIFMFTSFIFNGVVLGLISVYIVHRQLVKRLSSWGAWSIIGIILFLCSFAMYIGRELRWNSWDIVANPASLLFDVTDRLINAKDHPHMLSIMLSFFVLITSLYVTVWQMARVARAHHEAS
jgi:uncharacterized membrane protein